jgi:hypothetical protein
LEELNLAFHLLSLPQRGREGHRPAGPVSVLAHDRPPQPPSVGSRRQPATGWRRGAIGALSLLTAVWLAGQVGMGLRMKVHTWPLAAFPMFSEKRTSVAERSLEVRTRSGRVAVVQPRDFGLTDLQLQGFHNSIVTSTGMVRAQATDRLGRLAAAWNRRHPDDPATSMTLTNRLEPLRPGSPSSRQVVRWDAP